MMNQRSGPVRPQCNAISAQHRRTQRTKRRTLIVAALGVGALAAPTRWSKPIVDTVLLPAHAQLSTAPGEPPTAPLTDCAPATLTDGTSIAFTLSEADCSISSAAVAFLEAACSLGVTTLTIAPGVQWDYASSTPAGNPIVVAAGSGTTAITFVVEQLVTGSFYRMELNVTDDGTDCSLSEILVFGPFTSSSAAA